MVQMLTKWSKISIRSNLKIEIDKIIKKENKVSVSLEKFGNPTNFVDIAIKEKLIKINGVQKR